MSGSKRPWQVHALLTRSRSVSLHEPFPNCRMGKGKVLSAYAIGKNALGEGFEKIDLTEIIHLADLHLIVTKNVMRRRNVKKEIR